MRVYVGQVGCRLNFSEMESLARRLQAAGHTVVQQPGDAQVIVFNTCAVTADAVRGSRKEARRLHAAAPHARLALTGCWATLAPEEAAALPRVALVASNAQKELLPLLLEPWSAAFDDPAQLAQMLPGAPPALLAPESEPPAERLQRTRAFVKVQDGCNNRCTFCIVTVARGESRSRPIAEVVEEVRVHVAAGVHEVVLTGVHLGAWGRDVGSGASLGDLLAALLADTDLPRLRLSSLEPWEIGDGFFELWQQSGGRLCPHLHLPLQAGSDAQLRAMARRCTTASFRALAAAARAAIPDLTLTTDLIAGFPGEGEDDFAAGLAFVEEMRFLDAHIFPYSARPGTAAASFGGEPTSDIKRARARHLADVVARTGAAERACFVNSARPVLWEGRPREVAARPDARLWSGQTDNGLRVETWAPRPLELHGRLLPAHLAAGAGEILLATPLDLMTDGAGAQPFSARLAPGVL